MGDGRTGVGVAALLCALVLVGCTPDPAVTPSPGPTATSTTPTETDAERQERMDYAAAEKAYRTFRAEYGRVLRTGGAKEPTKVMKETAGGDYLKQVAEIAKAYQGLGDHRVGEERVMYVRPGGYEHKSLLLEVCEDSRGVEILDKTGKQVGAGELRTASITVRRTGDAWKLWSGRGEKVSVC